MFVCSVTCIHNRNIQVPRNVVWRAGSRVAHDKAIRLHRIQIESCVEKRLAFFQAGSFGLQIHRVCAQARSCRAKTDAGTRRIFKKCESNGFSAQSRKLFQRMALDFLEWLALIEKKSKFVRAERFQSQEIAKTGRHISSGANLI